MCDRACTREHILPRDPNKHEYAAIFEENQRIRMFAGL